MNIERKSFTLSKETGVLPGSEYFISTVPQDYPDVMQYLVMCGHYHCVEGYVIDRHYYDYLHLAYICAGHLRIRYEGKEYLAKAGDVIILDMHNPHYYAAVEHLEFIWIHVTGEISQKIYDIAYQKNGVIVQNCQGERIKESLTFLLSSFQTEQTLSPQALSAIIYSIMMNLLDDKTETRPKSPNEVVMTAIEYMKYHLNTPIHLDDIAQASHLSKYYFSRIFKTHTGYAPYDYLLKLRIDTAKHLLTSTAQTVREIALTVGYQSEMGFVIAFTNKVGIPPGKYREYHL